MATAQDYLDQLNAIIKASPLSAQVKTIAEAKLEKQRITQTQKQLRLVKSEIAQEMKLIRAKYSAEKEGAGSGGAALYKLMGKKGKAREHQAAHKRIKDAEKDAALSPYEKVTTHVEKYILACDDLKLKIDQYIEQHKA